MKPLVTVLALALLVAGCSSAQERQHRIAQRIAQECIDRGYKDGTSEFENCRLQLQQEEEKRREERMRWNDDFRPAAPPQKTYQW